MSCCPWYVPLEEVVPTARDESLFGGDIGGVELLLYFSELVSIVDILFLGNGSQCYCVAIEKHYEVESEEPTWRSLVPSHHLWRIKKIQTLVL